MRSARRTGGLGAALLLAASSASAQTNDPLFRSWSFDVEPPSARSAALGGAVDACADDAIAVQRNPAAISALHKAEVIGTAGLRGQRGAIGDTLGSRTGLSFVGGAMHLSPRLAAGIYAAQPHSLRLTLAATERPDGLHDDDTLETVVTELGAALAWQASGKLHLGGRLSARHLSLEGRYSREAQGTRNLEVDTSTDTTTVAGAAGVLFVPTAALRLGLVAETGRGWRVRRTATNPVFGVVLDDDTDYELRAPTRLSAGVAWRPHPRITWLAQVDRVQLGEIQGRLVIAQGAYARSEYALESAFEAAFGAELSLPFRYLGLQVRAGARSRAPDLLRYTGRDLVGRATFTGASRATVLGLGGGVFTRSGLHVDAALTLGRGTSVLVGAGLRF